MKIVFDHQIFSLQQYGGISRYFCSLAGELLKLNHDVRIPACFYINKYLGDLPDQCVPGWEIERFRSRFKGALMAINRWQDARVVRDISADILHETYYTNKPVKKHGARRVLTVYDMIHERFSLESLGNDFITDQKKAACHAADHIICISHSTKRDLCEIFSIKEEKISVIHLGFDGFSRSGVLDVAMEKPYVLFVGKRGGYKNFESTIRAIGRSNLLRGWVDIFAFGGGDFTKQELLVAKESGLANGSMRYFSGGDDVLGALYKKAVALIYPSMYEGFGLPPLEAMAHQCPVIASNSSSMPEVIGSAGILFDPNDIDEQMHSIERVVSDDALRKELISKGLLQLKKFSWKNCAQETLDVYNKF